MKLKQRLLRHAVKTSLRLAFKLPSRLPLPVGLLRAGMDRGAGLLPLRADARVQQLHLAGVATEQVSVGQAKQSALLHLHGGAFMVGSPASHRALASELAARSGAQVFVPDYRLAPEHPYPAALDDCLSAWQGLLDAGFAAEQIILSGDSAGGALALNLVLRLKAMNQPLPAALVLMSPYVDSSLQAASITSKRRRDPMLTRQVLKRGSSSYAASLALDDARISPLFADLAGLPPVLIQVGSEEILLDDALRLEAVCQAAGVDVSCRVYDGMWHDFQLFSRFLPEAQAALDDMTRFMTQQLRRQGSQVGTKS